MAVKILTSADIHIGRASSSSTDGKNLTTRGAWRRMVDWAIREHVDAVVLAGDIVDQANKYFEAVSALEDGLTKLDEAGIIVVMVSGNHDFDVLPSILKNHSFKNVYLLGENGSWDFETIELNGVSIQFTGWSFPSLHYKSDPLINFPKEKVDGNAVTVGLIHGDFTDAESSYAPLKINSMSGKGVNVWVMGHIHKPEQFNSTNPLIYYPGSPQALSAKEKGEHGATLLTIENDKRINTRHIPLSTIRYEEIEIDITGCTEEDEIKAKLIGESDSYLKKEITRHEYLEHLSFDILLTGSQKDLPKLERWMESWDINEFLRNKEGLQISIRKVRHQCTASVTNLESLKDEPSPAGLLAQAIIDLEAGENSTFIDSLRKEALSSMRSLNSHSTYLPLRDTEKIEQIDEDDINQLLLQECNRLLSQLIQTKAEG